MKKSVLLSCLAIMICAVLILSGCNFTTGPDSDSWHEGSDFWLGEASQNPMPVGGFTTIEYDAKGLRDGRMSFVNILGQEVRSIDVDNSGSIIWDGKDKHGRLCGSGVYYYKYTSGSYSSTGKLLLIK